MRRAALVRALAAGVVAVGAARAPAQEGAPPDAPEALAQPALPETAPAPKPRPAAPAAEALATAAPAAAPEVSAPVSTAAPRRGVLLRALDKFSGVATTLGVEPGRSARYERLSIVVRRCMRGAQGEMAYLAITDAKTPEAPVFEGWMFAESPALSALDHPRYDVWLASCNTRSGSAD